MSEPTNCPHCGATRRLETYRCGVYVIAPTSRTELCREREKSQKLEAERDEAIKDLIKNLQTTGGMPWREWRQQCVEETLRADENLARAHKAETEVERLQEEIEVRDVAIETTASRELHYRRRTEKAEASLRLAIEIASQIGECDYKTRRAFQDKLSALAASLPEVGS